MLNIILDFSFIVVLAICVIATIKKNDNEENNEFLEKYGNIIFVGIFIVAVLTLVVNLDKTPQGLHVDEGGAFYDAICLSKYGVDRYLNKLPVYLINFGGGQSALYAYLAALMMKLFGVSIFVFRMPSVILSLIAMIVLYQTIKENYAKKEAIFVTFILAICPWNIMKSRWGLDCNLMSSMLIISICAFVKSIKSDKSWLYAVSGVLFGLTLYTYAISYLVIPVVLGIVILYMLIIKKVKIKNVVIMAVPLGIFALPLILMLGCNSGVIPKAELPVFSIPELWSYRGGEISISNIPENLKNIFEILFFKDFLNYNAITEFGTLYKMSIPLVFFGIVSTIKDVVEDMKNKRFSLNLAMFVIFGVMFGIGLCIAELNINKINAIYIPMIYFAAKFLNEILHNTKYLWILVVALYFLNFGLFMNYYFTEFAKTDLLYFEQDIMDAAKKAEVLGEKEIYVENCLNQTYIYTLVATPISPYEFNENLEIQNGIVTNYGKYKFWIPQEIDENAVYVIKNDEQKIDELINSGFVFEKYGEFNVIWKSE